jgi:hypothetical protein
MDLFTIVNRISEGLEVLDAQDKGGRFNRRTKEPYLKGLKTMPERDVTTGLVKWWPIAHPDDFKGILEAKSEAPYPNSKNNDRCDILIREINTQKPVWAIEVKHIALVGDNGKNNDFGVAKMLSPYLKDRSLRHDMIRLRDSGFGCRSATVVYSFSYTSNTIEKASELFYSAYADRINEMEKVRASAADEKGVYSIEPMVTLVTHMLRSEGLTGDTAQSEFLAWAHPCGGNGIVAAWALP